MSRRVSIAKPRAKRDPHNHCEALNDHMEGYCTAPATRLYIGVGRDVRFTCDAHGELVGGTRARPWAWNGAPHPWRDYSLDAQETEYDRLEKERGDLDDGDYTMEDEAEENHAPR